MAIIRCKTDNYEDENYAGYGLYIPGHGECSWFRRDVLTLVKRGFLAEALEAMARPTLPGDKSIKQLG